MKNKAIKLPKQFRLAELFCGPGGLASAAQQSSIVVGDNTYSIVHAWANDIDHDTCETYAHNIKKSSLENVADSVICRDVREIKDFKTLPDFDALAFGFPCNDYSMVGEGKGLDGTFGPLYFHGVRAINARDPLFFIAENVGGLQSANEGKAFSQILHDLENSGKHHYKVTAQLYKFEDYGVPQARHRIIIVGIRQDLGLTFKVPAPTTPTADTRVTCKTALEVPPIADNAFNNDRTKQSRLVEERLMCTPAGKNAWYLDTLLAYADAELIKAVAKIPTFKKEFPEAKTAKAIRQVLDRVKLNVKSARMSHIYRRLNPKKPSYTLTGSGGGGTHVYHWSEPRALTNRERARLQTFDDTFEFLGNKESVRKQIGMAVPPRGAKVIFEAVLKTMLGVEYDSVTDSLYTTGGQLKSISSVIKDLAKS